MRLVRLAEIVRAVGLRGQVGVVGWDARFERAGQVACRLEGGHTLSFRRILEAREQGRVWVLKLEGIEDRNAAQALVGHELLARREDLGDPGEGQFWWFDVEGLPVWKSSGEPLGKVVGFYITGGVDVLVVAGEEGERLIPVAPYVDVDLRAGRITVEPPEGLLDIEEKGRRPK